MDFNIWLALFFAIVALSISPGAGALISINSGINYGLKKSYAAILGLQFGLILQIVIVIIGIGAIIASSEVLFNIVKWVGVLYLVYLGIKKILEKPLIIDTQEKLSSYNAKKLFLSATFINLTNPKATVFYVAFIPQFLDSQKPLLTQLFIICATAVIVDIIVMTGYSSIASKIRFLLKDEKAIKIQNIITGSFLVLVGIFAIYATNLE